MAIVKKIRLIELFGGIGSQAMALRDLGVDFENWRLVEFDPFAIKSYNAIHGTNFKPSDIRNIHGKDLNITETDKYCYLMTYSFPCQDLSVAGKQKGMSKGSETRSGLLWEVERILKELPKEQLPEVLLMENVPQVHSKKNKADFDAWLSFLSSKGYRNFWKDLNAKDYSIPQNRNRCFCVSVLVPNYVEFVFPNPVPLRRVMKDFLENEVDEKYYIKSEKAERLIKDLSDRGLLPNGGGQLSTCQSINLDKLKSPTALRQDMTQEYQTKKRTEAALLSGQANKINKITDIATCLMARDYKGFGNQTANGVIEN